MQYPAAGMGRLLREDELAAFAVKLRSPFDKLLYIFRAFGDECFYRTFVAQSGSGDQCVALVQLGLVIFGKNDRHTALGILGIRFARFVLGENGNVRSGL